MKQSPIGINGIPALLWGEESARLFIAVHGDQSRKDDDVIAILAEEASAAGCQTLSFDLPEHGARKNLPEHCSVQNCVRDLGLVSDYAAGISGNISLFACSIGAYFSLLAYKDTPLEQCLFLSPLVDMERLITDMMQWAGVTEQRLRDEREIDTPSGKKLVWDYYQYVREHPVKKWSRPTEILSGSKDSVCAPQTLAAFAKEHSCGHTVIEGAEHYFHTPEQLQALRAWLRGNIKPQTFPGSAI